MKDDLIKEYIVSQSIDKAESKYQTLAILIKNNIDKQEILVIGVFFGLIGALLLTLLYNLIINQLPILIQWTIFVDSVVLFGFLVWIFKKRIKKDKKKLDEVIKDRNTDMKLLNSEREKFIKKLYKEKVQIS